MAGAITGNITTTGNTNGVTLSGNPPTGPAYGDTAAVISFSGTYGASTINVEATPDGTNWFNVAVFDANTLVALNGLGGIVLAANALRAFKVPLDNFVGLRVWASAIGSGTLAVSIRSGAFFVNSPVVEAVSVGAGNAAQATLVTPGIVGTQVVGSLSGAASAINVSIPAVAGKTSYCSGFAVSGLGASSVSSIQIQLSGALNLWNWTQPIAAGVTNPMSSWPCVFTFNPPIAASAASTALTLVVPSFGSGNTIATASIYGYQL